jgi:hypothetical protein
MFGTPCGVVLAAGRFCLVELFTVLGVHLDQAVDRFAAFLRHEE